MEQAMYKQDQNVPLKTLGVFPVPVELFSLLHFSKDPKKLTDLKFAYNVILTTSTIEDKVIQLNILHQESKTVWQKLYRGKTRFMTTLIQKNKTN